ncbi:MAG: ATP-binding cassette domain-containing protein [Atopobiaceae bacterium]|nr:ATP-binding cassette domain-containing protein [Atopobiaceae bacterium]
MQDSTKIVSLKDVSFSYKKTPVLRDINLNICEGEICALIGDNGAGKSTISRIVVGELEPTSGKSLLFGVPSSHFKDWELVGYVPQLPSESVNRFPASVIELVDASQYARAKKIKMSSQERRERTREALELVGMTNFSSRIIRELSGGQLQRVRLACALVGNPSLLVLDEPTTGLDKESRNHFYSLVREAHTARNLAVLIVTHDLDALDALACRVIEVSDGKLNEIAGRGHGKNHCALHGAHHSMSDLYIHNCSRGKLDDFTLTESLSPVVDDELGSQHTHTGRA